MKKFLAGILAFGMVFEMGVLPVSMALEQEDTSMLEEILSLVEGEEDSDVVDNEKEESGSVPMTALDPSLLMHTEEEIESVSMTPLDPSLVIDIVLDEDILPFDESLTTEIHSENYTQELYDQTEIFYDIVIEESEKISTFSTNNWIYPEWSVGGGIQFDSSSGTIVDAETTITSVNIPSEIDGVTVVSIGSAAFKECKNLEIISLPNSLTNLGSSAFMYCTSLNSVSIPVGVSQIALQTFFGCTNLKSVDVPNGILSIGNAAFYECSSLEYISLPATVGSLGTYCFFSCTNLRVVELSYGITTIGMYSFNSCGNLESINLPSSLTSLGERIFTSCSNLKKIIIPVGVQNIWLYSFWNCTSLEVISFHSTLLFLDSGSFYYCNSLTDIYYGGTQSEWDAVEKRSLLQNFSKVTFHFDETLESDSITQPDIDVDIEIPSDGFAILIYDGDTMEVLTNVTISVTGMEPYFPQESSESSGVFVYEKFPSTDNNSKNITISIEKDGYYSEIVERVAIKGSFVVVAIYEDTGSPRVKNVFGTYQNKTVDLINCTVYDYFSFTANNNDVEDKTNTDILTLDITLYGDNKDMVSSYQLVQNDTVVVESKTPLFQLDVNDEVLVDFEESLPIYLRIFDENNQISQILGIGILLSEEEYDVDDEFTFKLGNKLGFTVGEDVPFFGGTNVGFGFQNIPYFLEVDGSSVKMGINLGDTFEGSDWDNIKGEIEDAYWKSGDEVAHYWTQELEAGPVKPKLTLVGFGEGHKDDDGVLYIDAYLVVKGEVSQKYNQNYLVAGFPLYITVTVKAEISANGHYYLISVPGSAIASYDPSFRDPSVSFGLSSKFTLQAEGGAGLSFFGGAGAGGRGYLEWDWDVSSNSGVEHTIDLTGELYIYATLLLFRAEKVFADATIRLWPEIALNTLSLENMLFSSEEYQLISRDYLYRPTSFSLAENIVKENVYSGAAPQLVEVNGTNYLFWLDDDGTRTSENRTSLVYSTSTDLKTWSIPQNIIDSDNADHNFQLSVRENDIHIIWNKSNTEFDNGVTLEEMIKANEIFYAVLDTSNNSVESFIITDDDTIDYLPVVVATTTGTTIAWLSIEGSVFDESSTHYINYLTIHEGQFGAIKKFNVEGVVSDLVIGEINGEATISYVVNSSWDNVNVDGEIWAFTVTSGISKKLDDSVSGNNPSTLLFSKLGGIHVLLWTSENGILYTSDLSSSNFLFTDSEPNMFNQTYTLFVDEQDTKLVWEAQDSIENSEKRVVYASTYQNGTWSESAPVLKTNNELSIVPSGYLANDGEIVVSLLQTLDLENPNSSLFVAKSETIVDVELKEIMYDTNDIIPNSKLPLSIEVVNHGNTVITEIPLTIGTQTFQVDSNVGIGETKIIEVTGYKLPESFSETITVEATLNVVGDENETNDTVEFSCIFTDLGVDATQTLISGSNFLSITIKNDSYFTTDATLSVFAESTEGELLHEEELLGLQRESSKIVLLNLDKLFSDTNCTSKILYIYIKNNESVQDERILLNNEKRIYLSNLGEKSNGKYIALDLDGGELATDDIILKTDENGKLSSLPIPFKENCSFTGWSIDLFDDNFVNENTIFEKSTTIYAQWNQEISTTYTATVINGTGGGAYSEEAVVTITANAPETGKIFDKWTTTDDVTFADENASTTTFIMPEKSVVIAASYVNTESIQTYTITFDSQGGSFELQQITDEKGTLSSLSTPIRTGYTFDAWYTSSTGGTKVSTSYVFTSDTTIYAQWTKSSTVGNDDDSPDNNGDDSNNSSNNSSTSTSTSSTTYTNTLPTSDNGTVTMTPTNPKSGDTVTLEITPKDGYEVSEVIVTRTSTGAEIEVTLNDDGTYSFTQPSGSVTIEVIFTEIDKSGTIVDLPIINDMTISTFDDMTDPSIWYYDPVKFVYDRGLMAGTSATLFSPELPTSRGMIVQILYRLAGSPTATGTNFSDVVATDYFADAVAWASSVGVAAGTGNNQFSPHKDMSREELVVMLYAYEKIYGNGAYTGNSTLTFADTSSVSSWAEEAVAWATGKGIIVGKDGNKFDPKGSAQRCEVAQILKNFIELYS